MSPFFTNNNVKITTEIFSLIASVISISGNNPVIVRKSLWK
jgi:hypothetical protein